MKFGLATKLNKRITSISKNLDDDLMSANCDVIVVFVIYAQFEATQKPVSDP